MADPAVLASLPDFWGNPWPTLTETPDEPMLMDAPPASDPASLYREAYYAGMADGPAPGTD